MARPPSAESILRNYKKQNKIEHFPRNNLILPNNSGDHKRSIKRNTPINDYDLVNKKYVDDNATSLWEIDGTETQLKTADAINMQSNKIINVTDPTSDQDAATKKYVDDNLPTPKDTVKATLANNESIPNATTTTIEWDSEEWDSNSMHDNSTNPERLTAKKAGKYLVISNIEFASNNVGARQVLFFKNGTLFSQVLQPNNVLGGDYLYLAAFVELAINDYVDCRVWQGSGGNLNIDKDRSSFGMTLITTE